MLRQYSASDLRGVAAAAVSHLHDTSTTARCFSSESSGGTPVALLVLDRKSIAKETIRTGTLADDGTFRWKCTSHGPDAEEQTRSCPEGSTTVRVDRSSGRRSFTFTCER